MTRVSLLLWLLLGCGGLWGAAAPVAAQDAPPASGEAAAVPDSLRNHDTSQPIDIEARSAEIRQRENQVVFEGAVRAVQGVLQLDADRLIALFSADTDQAERVEARGNVVIRSARRAARGAWAIYDVAARRVTMGGPVTFSQETGDRLTADRLVVDLETGLWQFEGADAAGVSGEFAVPDAPQ
ncbi:lipopolysaccharide export system protein LptA [Rhodothalassium salexigens DSM 2132]|uniref:Lipopolysaccharide export system protein LptA n=1 Tax=Rhodothalassium salexigens DSM 2132 TaxID=1188247 RepID=A0A4R2PKE1_RHOSA|nr:LptA/OstA family protein [Rhodothalassium salexigens]MBB4211323.1 lipopolysaccharide export system protein LptA [Rhodothalassium salexigens DSM 2132]MBK1639511.1 hypothetical protein [Rhodothalassium salexigens DSM 2132]TCP35244.1 lipopolysaccharide export system protein LptA [Rhodothalassium salexigens DSM 2132]